MIDKDIHQLFSEFSNVKVLIIGDVMIDSYYFGKVQRISPEAPVPIVSVENKENRLGGAANVALNVQALGAIPILCSVIGDDDDAKIFKGLLNKNEMSMAGIINSPDRTTTVKTRVIGNKQQVLRVDSEIDYPLSSEETQSLYDRVQDLIESEDISVIIFQDYDKGVITKELIDMITTLGQKKNIPIAADPKKRNFKHYSGLTLFKPNLKELAEGLNIEIDPANKESIEAGISLLQKNQHNEINFLTLSEHGVFVQKDSHHKHIAAHVRNVADVSGAGDTVISVVSLCLALNQDIELMAQIANIAGGLVCEKVGVVPIDKEMLLRECSKQLE